MPSCCSQVCAARNVISSDAALAALLPRLAVVDPIAIDTEADSLHCYFEKLCLVQISVPGEDVLVDPLADFSLAPLFEMLATKELVLHGADYDLRLMRRVGFTEPRVIFDTMIAARLVGQTEFSLAALITKYFGVTLAKGSQKANWAKRPLSALMAEYAKNDTHYLLELADKLGAELRSLNRWEWFRQSCARAIEVAKTDRDRDVENIWRISGSHELRGLSAAVLRALWQWRDQEARAVDRPPFHILQNDKLIECARAFATGGRVSVPHLSSSRAKRFFAAAESALRLPEEEWPMIVRKPRPRSTPDQDRLFNALKIRRDKAASELRLDPTLIAPKAVLESLAADQESAKSKLLPWQRELLELSE